MKYPPEYFANQTEQAKIKSAIVAAIPNGVTYYNLVMALTDVLHDFSRLAFAEKIMHYDPKVVQESQEAHSVTK